jgi:hypothetical protein
MKQHLHSHLHKKTHIVLHTKNEYLNEYPNNIHIQTIHILKIIICTKHQNMYDVHVMAYNFMYYFQHTIPFYTYKQ